MRQAAAHLGLQGRFKPLQRRFSCGILGSGPGRGASPGTDRWGRAWVPAPSQVYPFTLLGPSCPQQPRHHPTPTPPPKLRGSCHSAAEEPLVQPGVGRQGRPGSAGKDLHSARRSRTLSCVQLSAHGRSLSLLLLLLDPPGGALRSPSPPHLCQVFSDSAPPLLICRTRTHLSLSWSQLFQTPGGENRRPSKCC